MRDKLIELIKEARDIGDRHCEEMGSCAKCHELGYDIGKCGEIIIADHLIANGVKLDVADTNVGDKPMTNGQRIRAMTDEELAEEMVFYTGYRESAWSEMTYCNLLTGRDDTRENAIKGTIEWLKQTVEK